MSTIYTSFPTVNLAERAIGALLDHGVNKDAISVIANENHAEGVDLEAAESKGKTGVTTTTGADAARGAAKGAGVGVVVGVLGALACLTIPGFGLVMGGGALATAVAAAAGTAVGGAVVGSVAGYLDDQGVPNHVSQRYQDTVNQGGAVVAVTLPSGKCDEIAGRDILAKYQGTDFVQDGRMLDHPAVNTAAVVGTAAAVAATAPVASRPAQTATVSDRGRTNDSGAAAIPVIQEELQVGKRQVQSGGVRVETHVSETPVEQDVRLREEHVSVTRHPVDRAATDADFHPLAGGSIEVTETAEEAVVAKKARVVEEVLVTKDVSQRTEHISDTVRRTDVEVTQLTDTFRKDFASRYGGKNFKYEQVEPAYQYGYDFATNPSYSGKDWTSVEPSAKTAWSSKYTDRRWEDYGDAIRYGYEQNKTKRI
jgi:uncharacterized protein (TIGR02271 family)